MCMGNVTKSLMFFASSIRIKYLYVVPMYIILVVISVL